MLLVLSLLACGDVASTSALFDVKQDVPAFANAPVLTGPHLLGPSGMVELFGDTVCLPGTADAGDCTLKPEADLWLGIVNAKLAGGRCDGFAATVQASFGTDASLPDWDEGDIATSNVITRWQFTQELPAVIDDTKALGATQVEARLTEEFATGLLSSRIGMVGIDPSTGRESGGHAVVPFAIFEGDVRDSAEELGLSKPSKGDELGNKRDRRTIWVYDPNRPDRPYPLELDVGDDAWRYDAGSIVFEGSVVDSNDLFLTTLESRYGPHPCHFCAGTETGEVQVFGDVVASIDAETVDETPLFNSPEWAADTPPPKAFVTGDDVTIALRPSDEDGAAPLFGLWRDGYAAVASGENVEQSLRVIGDDAVYETDSTEPVSLGIVGELDGRTRVFAVISLSGSEGHVLDVQIDEGTLTVDVEGKSEQDLVIHLQRYRGTRVDRVAIERTIARRADLRLHLADWPGTGVPVAIDLDSDGDGRDDEVLYTDDCGDCPLPGPDLDGVDDAFDACPNTFDASQRNTDEDQLNDACDPSPDGQNACAVGTWDHDDDVSTACKACKAGQYCPGGRDAPHVCSLDEVDHDEDPTTPCVACDDGFTTEDGLTCSD